MGSARRYRRDVSPFYAIGEPTPQAWRDLAELAADDDHPIVLTRCDGATPPEGWTEVHRGSGHQMIVAGQLAPSDAPPLRLLTDDDVPAMLDLIALTKPGPFLPRTVELGGYYGTFDGGRLIAMAGRRMQPDGFAEISAVCTHPDARGRGLAAGITRAVALQIEADGQVPFLHVAGHNDNARRVYERLGFVTRRFSDFIVLKPPS